MDKPLTAAELDALMQAGYIKLVDGKFVPTDEALSIMAAMRDGELD